MKHVTVTSPVNRRILAVLTKTPDLTAVQIAEAVHCSLSTLRKPDYLINLRRSGLIYIASWERAGVEHAGEQRRSGPPIERYRIGSGPDAPRPRKRSRAELCRVWRKSPAGRAHYARLVTKKFGINVVDPLLAALMRPLSVEQEEATA